MGHRCNLVAKRGGGVEVYYSHWGALGLLADLLKGPSSIADWLKDCTRDEQLIDNVFSEGIALADFDDQLLLLRGGVMIRHILPVRLAYLEMLRAGWPGWRVEWADRGVLDVAQHVAGSGRDPSAYSLSAERIRTFIADELFPAVEHDPVASTRRLEARLREAGDEPTVSPEALKYSRPK